MIWYGPGSNNWPSFALMVFNMMVFWALLIGAVLLLVRSVRRNGQAAPGGGRSRAEELLAERYARGEIDDEEYARRLETLRRP
jgi:putative membrane protein